MLGLGLESVGYSSVKSEFFSPGDAKARSLAENTARLLKRNSQGVAFADARLTGWQEAIVAVEPQEAVALATIIGLPDGYYGEGSASSGASIWAAPNKVQRGSSHQGAALSQAVGDEHVTRNAYAQPVAIASAYGEWQLNNELFATGHARPSATLQSQAYVYPALEPLIGGCDAYGSARVRFKESSKAIIMATAETLACEHRKGARGDAALAAYLDGMPYRTFALLGKSANAYAYADGQVTRTLFPDAEIHAQAAGEATTLRITPAGGAGVFGAGASTGEAMKYLVGDVDAFAVADAEGGVKLNDYYPAPSWRLIALDGRQDAMTVDQSVREMVV
jgi:hypothetical protein